MKPLLTQKGFTLIEALVAMVVLTIGILSLYTMQVSSINGNATANHLTVATTVANNCYERLWNTPYNHATMTDTAGAKTHTQAELAGLSLPQEVTSVRWGVTTWTDGDTLDNDGDVDIDEDDETNIKLVALDVNYTDRAVAKTMTVTFYKSELF
jgi:prepilin-type N-terminal cleavage/methylation domain-containing protein